MAVLFGLRRMPAASADRDAELSGRAPAGSLRGSGLERQSSHRPVEGMRSVELHGGGSLALAGTLAGAQSLALDLRAPAPPAPDGEPALPFRRGLGSVFANASAPLGGGSARLPPRSPSAELLAAARAGREPTPGAGPAGGAGGRGARGPPGGPGAGRRRARSGRTRRRWPAAAAGSGRGRPAPTGPRRARRASTACTSGAAWRTCAARLGSAQSALHAVSEELAASRTDRAGWCKLAVLADRVLLLERMSRCPRSARSFHVSELGKEA